MSSCCNDGQEYNVDMSSCCNDGFCYVPQFCEHYFNLTDNPHKTHVPVKVTL